ncbi:MAG: hypothetical protein VKQ33_15835 [Candidatus Sericytochromatia bacterium]|nr:hypothetical protein [Candidatus Sericytochromatia bacterium]
MKKPTKPHPPGQPGAGGRGAPASRGPGRAGAGGAARPANREPLAPRFRPTLPDPGPKASPREQLDFLGGQVQSLATRLEVLRGQGAGEAPEFRQLEQVLAVVQGRLLLAQRRLEVGR